MRPGRFSVEGFLGPDERLADVLAQDAQTLRQLGVSFEQIAAHLDRLITAAEENPRRTARVDRKWDISIIQYRGFQICPWATDPHHSQCTAGQGVQHASIDWELRNLVSGRSIAGPGLIVHLIRDHHFFEGRQSPYRVDPQDLIEVLDLNPGS